ncbi:MAG: type II secretion system protein GspG, partial [Armatimonadetes bacterium]|nr:type II secretion system protein GspG [Armatimonadota bacterium]
MPASRPLHALYPVLFILSLIALLPLASAQTLRLETQVRGQNAWLAKSTAALRVIAKDHDNGQPLAGAKVEIDLTPSLDANGKPRGTLGAAGRLYSGQTGADGSLDASFAVPNVPPGSYGVQVIVEALGEKDVVHQPLTLRSAAQILLTSDKPLYQPGQVIHLRALALQQPSLSPLAGTPITLEVSDGKGNKVFKRTGTTSSFGVASADFQLADEVNLGTYRLRAETPAGSVERTVKVDRYVLPKFKVASATDRRFYAPGQVLTGNIQADYFFGKPVNGRVKVVLSRFDVGFNDFATVEGTLNASGFFQFSQKLPDFFAGTPLEQGNAFVKIETTVTDTADHAEKIVTTVPVTAQNLRVTAIPESGDLVSGVVNTIYLVTNTPNGTPVAAQVTVTPEGGSPITASTDASGLGAIQVIPTVATHPKFTLQARDSSGNTGSWSGHFTMQSWGESLLLHAERALYKVGETARLTALSPSKTGTVYFDVIRNGQTVLTDSAELADGRATLDLAFDNATAGTLEVHAYRLTATGQAVRDTRLLFVEPANDLKIAVGGSGGTYLPGSTAKLAFKVTDRNGAGVAAALGVNIVDESVFALQEMQPGMEKVYFLLEKAILEPRYEIHGVHADDLIAPAPGPEASDTMRQKAALALFAQVPPLAQETLFVNSFTAKLQLIHDENTLFLLQDAQKVQEALLAYHAAFKRYPTRSEGIALLVKNGLLPSFPQDRWGRTYKFEPFGEQYGQGFSMATLGADGREVSGDEYYASWFPNSEVQSMGRTLILRGDADRSRKVDVKDAVHILRAAVRLDTPDTKHLPYYDANADTEVNVTDAIEAIRISLGLKESQLALTPPLWGCPECREDWGGPVAGPVGPPQAGGTTTGGTTGGGTTTGGTTGGAPDVRIRQFFPETLYSNPAIITDAGGNAEIEVSIADSITTWRISSLASSQAGGLGSSDAPLRVFQEFFADIDFPVRLTQDDEVSVPVAVYNYLPTAQTVTLTAEPGEGFELLDSATQQVTLQPNEVKGAKFRVKAKGIGMHAFLVRAQGQSMADAIRRSVEIVPNGARAESSVSGRLNGTVEQTIRLPEEGIPGAFGLLVKVYPGLFSQLVEGMDAIFQMPFGCFEQTTSTTYPNVLALAYLKKTGKAAPEVQMKAEGYINLGYQRLVTFEVPGGGFEWFGRPPANQVLTAYGLLEFTDMSKVYPVDPALITRTAEWLAAKQQPDGTWKPDQEYLHDGIWNNLTNTELPVTSYVAWALAESGYRGPALALGGDAVRRLWKGTDNVYFLGLAANALVAMQSAEADAVLQKLLDLRKTTDDGLVYWESAAPTLAYTRGPKANVEATAYIAYALVRSGKYGDVASKALSWLVKQKAPNGTWGNTQATVMALKALISSLEAATSGGNRHLTVTVNGEVAGSHEITPENLDVLWQLDAKRLARPGDNAVKIEVTGEGQSMFQIAGWGYVPWAKVPEGGLPGSGGAIPSGQFDLSVTYDRTELDANAIVSS